MSARFREGLAVLLDEPPPVLPARRASGSSESRDGNLNASAGAFAAAPVAQRTPMVRLPRGFGIGFESADLALPALGGGASPGPLPLPPLPAPAFGGGGAPGPLPLPLPFVPASPPAPAPARPSPPLPSPDGLSRSSAAEAGCGVGTAAIAMSAAAAAAAAASAAASAAAVQEAESLMMLSTQATRTCGQSAERRKVSWSEDTTWKPKGALAARVKSAALAVAPLRSISPVRSSPSTAPAPAPLLSERWGPWKVCNLPQAVRRQ
mmetsp:Transcript_60276/g.197124  ORF Transcript_60276/g.197124 Transcript_60276/m.197124 type:complete len:264 (-) Transcript_60276:204-995(-)